MTTKQHDQAWRAVRLARAQRHPHWPTLRSRYGALAEERILAVQWLAETALAAGVDEAGRLRLNQRHIVVYEGSAALDPWQAAEVVWAEHLAGGRGVADA